MGFSDWLERQRIRPLTRNELARLPPDTQADIKMRVAERRTKGASYASIFIGLLVSAATVWNAANTLKNTREEQYTGRYTKAVEELGNRDSADVRMGGVFALQDLAARSPRDYGDTATQMLAAYVRMHIREHALPPPGGTRPMPNADVQAALRALSQSHPGPGRSYEDRDLWRLNANKLDLQRINLSSTFLVDAHLSESTLTGAKFIGAKMSYADLSRSSMLGGDLRWADLSFATLKNADLTKVDLRHADLRSADLSGANLSGADLRLTKGINADNVRKIAITNNETRF